MLEDPASEFVSLCPVLGLSRSLGSISSLPWVSRSCLHPPQGWVSAQQSPLLQRWHLGPLLSLETGLGPSPDWVFLPFSHTPPSSLSPRLLSSASTLWPPAVLSYVPGVLSGQDSIYGPLSGKPSGRQTPRGSVCFPIPLFSWDCHLEGLLISDSPLEFLQGSASISEPLLVWNSGLWPLLGSASSLERPKSWNMTLGLPLSPASYLWAPWDLASLLLILFPWGSALLNYQDLISDLEPPEAQASYQQVLHFSAAAAAVVPVG